MAVIRNAEANRTTNGELATHICDIGVSEDHALFIINETRKIVGCRRSKTNYKTTLNFFTFENNCGDFFWMSTSIVA